MLSTSKNGRCANVYILHVNTNMMQHLCLCLSSFLNNLLLIINQFSLLTLKLTKAWVRKYHYSGRIKVAKNYVYLIVFCLTLLAPTLMPSNSSMNGLKLNLRTLRNVLPESGVMSNPMMSDMAFQCRERIPGLHITLITGMWS